MDTPDWYIELSELAPFVAEKNWPALHIKSKDIVKKLYANAPSVKSKFEPVILITMQTRVSEEDTKKIEAAYQEALEAAVKEIGTDDFSRVMSEEIISDKLDQLSERISSSVKIIWNYWWGENSGDYKGWEAILVDIENTPLTHLGRLRLLARHQTIGQRILPSFIKMAVQLWPIAALWVIKKVGTLLITSTVSKTLETRKTKKQLKGFGEKMKAVNLNVGSLKPKRKKNKRKN